MQEGQFLIPMDADVFWGKIRDIIEDVLNERDKARQLANQAKPQLLKVREVCELFQVSKPTVYDWIRKGQLHSAKIGSRRFFLSSDIEELIARNRVLPNE